MLIFEMFYTFTGNLLHEVVGIVFIATLILHFMIERKWTTSMATSILKRRSIGFTNVAKFIISALLIITTLSLALSSAMISNLILLTGIDLAGNDYLFWSNLHTISAYALCALTVTHVAIHWAILAKVFKIPYNPERRRVINTGVTSLVALSAVALGVTASSSLGMLESKSVEASEDEPGEKTSSKTEPSDSGLKASESDIRSNAFKNGQSDTRPNSKSAPQNGSSADNARSSSNIDGEPSSSNNSERTPSSGSNSGQSNGFQNNGSTSSGYCTLCHERCQLSSPRCNKPYRAGLI